jgi:hypothetical protein
MTLFLARVARLLLLVEMRLPARAHTGKDWLRRWRGGCERIGLRHFAGRETRVPRWQADSPSRLHTLLCHRDVPFFIACAQSLLHWEVTLPPWIIHDDGSLCAEDRALLQRTLPGVAIISRAEADARMQVALARHPACARYRAQNTLALKLFDFCLLAPSMHTAGLDADILFFRRPTDLFDTMADGGGTLRHLVEHGTDYRQAFPELARRYPAVPTGFNSGLTFIPAAAVDLDRLEEIVRFLLEYATRNRLRCDDQWALALLAAGSQSAPWPECYVSNPEYAARPKGLTMMHYHSWARHLFFIDGIRHLDCHRRAHPAE